MDRKPQSFSLTVCCVIQLWNDGIIARSAHFKLPRVLTHILGKFHYSLCNPQSVLVRIFSSLPLFCASEKAAVTVAEMSVLSDTDCKIRQEIFFDSTSAHQTEKTATTISQMLIRCRCLKKTTDSSLNSFYFLLTPIAMQDSPAHTFHFSTQLEGRPFHFSHKPQGP